MKPSIEAALVMGRLAAAILEAPPLNEQSYSENEIAAQYAATDSLIAAFRRLDAAIVKVAN